MASGFNGQSFSFHGYLPIDANKRKQLLIQLEGESRRHDRTQLFMEAPHRNNELFKAVLENCSPQTWFSVATDITLETEEIATKPVSEWKTGEKPDLHKRPTIFSIYAK
jgi:16S rRNA (cytidine1402-2'-O)-methyltransferase